MTEYNEKSIETLTDKEHVQLRPTMYVGDTSPREIEIPYVNNEEFGFRKHIVSLGYIVCLREIIDNAIDIIRHTKIGNTISISFDDKTKEFCVADNSVGVPIGSFDSNKYTPEVVFGSLRSGKNFKTKTINIGMNGMGASITNFLSLYFKVKINRENKCYTQTWTKGLSEKPKIVDIKSDTIGTKIVFKLDKQYFSNWEPDKAVIEDFITLIARLNTDIKFKFNEEKIKTKGIKDYKVTEAAFYANTDKYELLIIPMHDTTEGYTIFSSVNGVPTFYGGHHIEDYESVFVDQVKKIVKSDNTVHKSNILKGLIIFIALNNVPDVLFDSQAKTKLITVDAFTKYMGTIHLVNQKFFKKEKDGWVAWIIDSFERKTIAKRLKQKKKSTTPEYFHAKDMTNAEVYIVEGNSAISDLLSVRHPNQGCLPLRGKIMNVLEKKLSEVVKSDTVINLIEMLNINIDSPSDCKYDKIIIATDADPDGLHIQSLLINFFYYISPDLVDRLYILNSPLYVVEGRNKYEIYYNKKDFLKSGSTGDIRYNKGLGSLTEREWEAMIDENRRDIIQVVNSNNDVTKKTIVRIFGKDSSIRKKWLATTKSIYEI